MPTRSLTLLLLVCAFAGPAVSAEPEVLIKNVSVLPMTSEEVLANRDVLIRDGRFVAIEPTGTITVPADVEMRDGSGKYLIPGLMDLHIHLKFGEEIQPDMLYLYLANGHVHLFWYVQLIENF